MMVMGEPVGLTHTHEHFMDSVKREGRTFQTTMTNKVEVEDKGGVKRTYKSPGTSSFIPAHRCHPPPAHFIILHPSIPTSDASSQNMGSLLFCIRISLRGAVGLAEDESGFHSGTTRLLRVLRPSYDDDVVCGAHHLPTPHTHFSLHLPPPTSLSLQTQTPKDFFVYLVSSAFFVVFITSLTGV